MFRKLQQFFSKKQEEKQDSSDVETLTKAPKMPSRRLPISYGSISSDLNNQQAQLSTLNQNLLEETEQNSSSPVASTKNKKTENSKNMEQSLFAHNAIAPLVATTSYQNEPAENTKTPLLKSKK